MRWEGQRRSGNVEDRRGMRVPGGMAGGGIGTIVVVMLDLVGHRREPADVVPGGRRARRRQPGAGAATARPARRPTIRRPSSRRWSSPTPRTPGRGVFQQGGERYQPPTLVLFTDAVESACGTNSAAVGPFYCPLDRKVYIDLSFFRELDQQFGAPGDFAQAYVIAHEVGHHVQTLLGISERVDAGAPACRRGREQPAVGAAGAAGRLLRRRLGPPRRRARNLLDPGDVEEGLQAAASIGDDTIQRRGRGRVSPESWTHGSSEQRVEWLRRGLTQGTMDACDTFGQGTRR